MRNLVTALFREVIYYSQISHELFPEKQKGCHQLKRGTGDLLFIVQRILKERKTRRKNIYMVLIDNIKANDMVPQTRIINCFKMHKIFDKLFKFVMETMKKWKGKLIAGGKL